MPREFADALFFSSAGFGLTDALRTARSLRLLNTGRPFIRAVPGGWLATVESCATLRDGRGNGIFEFHDYRSGIRIGFRKEAAGEE